MPDLIEIEIQFEMTLTPNPLLWIARSLEYRGVVANEREIWDSFSRRLTNYQWPALSTSSPSRCVLLTEYQVNFWHSFHSWIVCSALILNLFLLRALWKTARAENLYRVWYFPLLERWEYSGAYLRLGHSSRSSQPRAHRLLSGKKTAVLITIRFHSVTFSAMALSLSPSSARFRHFFHGHWSILSWWWVSGQSESNQSRKVTPFTDSSGSSHHAVDADSGYWSASIVRTLPVKLHFDTSTTINVRA